MIELKKLKELVKLMADNELTELDLQGDNERVTLKRESSQAPVQYIQQPVPVAAAPVPAAAAPTPAAGDGGAGGAEGVSDAAAAAGLVPITSPMVGTFYTSSSPDAEAFVTPGARVSAESVVCIIEAMKVFNEIKAELSGTVEEVLIENGQPVEFGQPLFLIKPS